MKRTIRFLSALLILCLALSLIPTVFAGEAVTGDVTHVDVAVPSTRREGTKIPTYITLPGSYDETNRYPLVVMLHGHGGNHNEWGGYDTISDGLARQGAIVVTMDFSGCGASTESFQLNNLTNMKDDVVDVVNHLIETYAIDITRIGGFGYSMGGRLILELTAESRIKFSSIELVAPAEDIGDLKDLFVTQDVTWETMKETAKAEGFYQITTVYGQVQQLGYQFFTDLEKYSDGLVELVAGKYDGNSLVIWATDDAAVRPHVSAGVAEVLGSATINTYTDGHSYSFYGTDPYTIATVNNACIDYFVSELLETHDNIYGYAQSIESDGSLKLALDESALDAAGCNPGDKLSLCVDGKYLTAYYATASTETPEDAIVLLNLKGTLTLVDKTGSFVENQHLASKTTKEDGTTEWYLSSEKLPIFVEVLMNPFTDVAEDTWYYDYVMTAVRKGLANGYEDNTFRPELGLTRAEMVTLLYRTAGSPAVEGKPSFTDLPNDWCHDAVAWAEQNNITTGTTKTTFEPDLAVTREQMVTMLWRMAGKPEGKADLADFEDASTVTDWATDAIHWAVAAGILNGTKFDNDEGLYLAPQNGIKRCEATKILVVFTEE